MKLFSLPSLILTVSLLGATPAFCQAPATTPGTTAPADKPKPLGSTDKIFVKNSLESVYMLINFSDKRKADSMKVEDTKAVATKLSTEGNKLWTELSTVANANDLKLPDAVPASDKSKLDRITKGQADKFDREWLKLVGREVKHLSTAFNGAARTSDEALKTIVLTWTPTLKQLVEDCDAAEKAAAKAK